MKLFVDFQATFYPHLSGSVYRGRITTNVDPHHWGCIISIINTSSSYHYSPPSSPSQVCCSTTAASTGSTTSSRWRWWRRGFDSASPLARRRPPLRSNDRVACQTGSGTRLRFSITTGTNGHRDIYKKKRTVFGIERISFLCFLKINNISRFDSWD